MVRRVSPSEYFATSLPENNGNLDKLIVLALGVVAIVAIVAIVLGRRRSGD